MLAEEITYPTGNIRQILRACKADEPLRPNDPRRHDFSKLRGGHGVVTDLADTLEQEPPQGEYHHTILCGHRGSGKSTELLSLKQWADENSFLTIWMEVDLYYGLGQLQFSDLYLLAAQAVERTMNDIDSPLPADLLDNIVRWFATVTQEDIEQVKSELELKVGAEVKAPLSIFGKLFAKFSAGVKAGSEHHLKVQQTLRRAPDLLVNMVNKLLQTANNQITDKHPAGLLLLFDNLDRYEKEHIRALLMHQSTLVRALGCHVVFTMPIDLHYKAESAYWDDYGPPAMLLMLALRDPKAAWSDTVKGSVYDEDAVSDMLAALSQRIDVKNLFQDVDDARLLVRMSGGCMRDLLHLVNQTRAKSRRSPTETLTHLTPEGVQDAVNEYRQTPTEGLTEADYQRLVKIAHRELGADVMDDQMLKLLNLRAVLRYATGGSRWNDVHPLVIETKGFRNVIAGASTIIKG